MWMGMKIGGEMMMDCIVNGVVYSTTVSIAWKDVHVSGIFH
jgi:hypothetical protein